MCTKIKTLPFSAQVQYRTAVQVHNILSGLSHDYLKENNQVVSNTQYSFI